MRVSKSLFSSITDNDLTWKRIWNRYLDKTVTIWSVDVPNNTPESRIMYEKCKICFPKSCFICHKNMMQTTNVHHKKPICKKCIKNRDNFASKTEINFEMPWFTDEIIRYIPHELKRVRIFV